MKLAEKILHEIKKVQWSKSSKRDKYSKETLADIKKSLPKARKSFETKNKISKNLNQDKELYTGTKYDDDDNIIWALESSVKEDEFKKAKDAYLQDVLRYAAEGDYYYRFEKEY